jgi:GNAT superfamily N-acetyltransferase
MVGLLRSVGWDGRTVDVEGLGLAIDGTPEFAAAWDGDRLVGTARSLTDGAMYAHIATVVVHPRYQGLGVGERLMHALMDGREHVRFALSAAPGMDAWYAKLGFAPDSRAMVRQRQR